MIRFSCRSQPSGLFAARSILWDAGEFTKRAENFGWRIGTKAKRTSEKRQP
jgi:hypothetical protein